MLGFSAGFANALPIVALISALLLFALATPVLLYKSLLGLILGLIFLLAILPYTFGLAWYVLNDGVYNWGALVAVLPALLIILSIYTSARCLYFQRGVLTSLPKNMIIKTIMAILPIGLTMLYFILYGKAWV